MSNKKSISPDGQIFYIPGVEEESKEVNKIRLLAENAKNNGKEVVVVMGMGFVGIVMAAIVADAPNKFVIGCQRPSVRSYWKIPIINNNTITIFIFYFNRLYF